PRWRIDPNYVLYGIIALNGLVFLKWQLAISDAKTSRSSESVQDMLDNYTSRLYNLLQGRVWTLITPIFSHKDTGHLLFNMITFWCFAPVLLGAMGSTRFLSLYFASGLVSEFCSLAHRSHTKADVPSLGASGAISGIMAYLACVAPTTTFLIYGIVPVPAWLAVGGFFLFDLASTFDNRLQPTTDTMGHVGGTLYGVIYFLARRGR
ncbi:rhomboid-domain-containing protein, partial [Fistulina hepatica ATCC 64428]